MVKTYTFSEAQQLLGVDPKTFRKWVDRSGIDVTKQVSALDERVKYLTDTQLGKIAKDHGKDLTAPSQPANDTGLAGRLKLLTDRFDTLDMLYDAIEKHNDALYARIDDQSKEIADLKARIEALESKPKAGRKPKSIEAHAQGDDPQPDPQV